MSQKELQVVRVVQAMGQTDCPAFRLERRVPLATPAPTRTQSLSTPSATRHRPQPPGNSPAPGLPESGRGEKQRAKHAGLTHRGPYQTEKVCS